MNNKLSMDIDHDDAEAPICTKKQTAAEELYHPVI